ncbi:carbohydrate ABC transporter substrate-binding protein [Mediterraneibacter gnavus]|jgi:N-acetylglucosamine transport system substrate-binding protein|uniref:Carbohydrate ABC transporter substrate-binding protein n=1 Tax=Mediterraneibacter gnavus TaxID=33038 RepID=A0A414SI40_MEDGN|nr:carbohydrate ABC transporter substrate-binding protein [Mediterraneibacter gnavus]RHG19047.1 carbohydrate ABC transporter substrate-binding protein [Mediterraneibacter gnavus]
MKKKVVRKLMALALVSAMATSMLAGCGSGDDSGKDADKGSEETVLKVAAFEGGNGTQIWEDIAKAFEESHDGVKVELEMSPELDKDLTKAIQNGDVPDVVYYNLGQPSGFTETMLKEEAIADISDVFDDELKDKMLDGILDGTDAQPYGDGKIYLAPIFYTPTGFWYNATLVGEGKQYEIPTTWDEFFALGEQAKKDGHALFTFPTTGYFDATIYAMLAQAGGLDFYNDALKYDANTWTSDEGKKVLDTVAKLVGKDYTQEDTVSNANADGGFKINQQNVIDGKALFMPNGNWVIGEMAASTPADYEWGMMGVPKWSEDESQSVYTFTEQMWVPADAPNMDLAKEFVKFMYSDEVVDICLNNKTTDKESGKESDTPVVVPVKGAADKLPDGVTKDCYAAATADDVVAVTGKWATTAPIEGLDMAKAVYGPVESINTGDMTVDEWQKQLVETWEKCADALEK